MSGPSRTARRVAERRAAHQLLDDPLVLADPFALPILGATAPDSIAALIAREQGVAARPMRAFMAARSRVAEDEVARLVEGGLSQYVVLGAGLDTFGIRNPFADRLHVFEVDRPSTQDWKRQMLGASDLSVPATTAFVAVDFERDDLFARLEDSGWDRSRPAFFAWLGVTMYLEPSTVIGVLRAIGELAGGSGVVFDYAVAPHLLGPIGRRVYEEFARRVEAIGEPWICAFDPADLRADLERAGFTTIDDLGEPELNERYFRDRADGLRVGSLAHVVRAFTR